ncbi:MAG: hypothetical protein ACI9MR_003463 [Myxococcota bacterium]|jgi:hypothetical protein
MFRPMQKPLLPPEDEARVLQALSERHGAMLRNERFSVRAERVSENVTTTVELSNADRTFVYAMSAALERGQYKGMTEVDALDACFDFTDWYLGEFFREQRELLLPIDWQPHSFGDVELMAKGELRNEFLDDAADAWLRGERPDVDTAWKSLKKKG